MEILENAKDRVQTELKHLDPVSCVVIGGGQRGFGYSRYAKDFPHLLKVVGVADVKQSVCNKFKKAYQLNDKQIFSDWKDLLKIKKIADFAMICTPDKLHKEPAVAMARKGYHILLEKPMATSVEDCKSIVEACKNAGVMMSICHVLRYFPPNLKIKELIKSGAIGEVVNIQHLEPVGFFHFAHSYVRGNWRNEKESCFSLLAKSCHDIDLICNWMDEDCISISSFGSLNHFKQENRPKGGGKRCSSCKVESSCCYSALKIYQEPAEKGYFGWPVSVVTDVEDLAVLKEKLRSGPYGRCVYNCDNDVCDNQVVNMKFKSGKTASFTMVAFTEKICQRETKVFGTKGQLSYNGGDTVVHYDFLTQKSSYHLCPSPIKPNISLRGHNGADFCLMDAFVKAVLLQDSSLIKSKPDDALSSHNVVFAAEHSRRIGKTLHRGLNGSWSTELP